MAGRVGPAGLPYGALIVFEGPDGVGKTTQLDALATSLRAEGRSVRCLREPGSTQVAMDIRVILLRPGAAVTRRAELLLFLASRADLWETEVIPALRNGEIVLLDRASLSTCAYQGAGRGLPMHEVVQGCLTAQSYITPEATLILTASDATLAAHNDARGQGKDRIELESDLFTQRVRRFYRDTAESAGGVHGAALPTHGLTGPVHAISAEGTFAEVAARVHEVATYVLGQAANQRHAHAAATPASAPQVASA